MNKWKKEMKLKEFIDFMKGGAGWAHPWVVMPIGKALARVFDGYPNLEKEVTVLYESDYERGRGYFYSWIIGGIPYSEVEKFCPEVREILPCRIMGASEVGGFRIYFWY